ncbi:MAG: GNAT family N-acetyltransferase [Rhizobiaceae bacterium]|nr:GNAT family N-acetyltransferase [Rhizobiaceae bacterium]
MRMDPATSPPGQIRQLRPSDRCRFGEHLLRLDRGSRRDRFNGAASDEQMRAYAERCFRDGVTVVACVEDDRVLGAAEIHERPDLVPPTGEIAFSVERAWQKRGIGGRLFERTIAHARAMGYTRLLVTTHPQNLAMKALARRFGADLHFVQGEAVGTITLPPEPIPPLPFSRRPYQVPGN